MNKLKTVRAEEVAEGRGVGRRNSIVPRYYVLVYVCDVIGRYDICEVLPVVASVILPNWCVGLYSVGRGKRVYVSRTHNVRLLHVSVFFAKVF